MLGRYARHNRRDAVERIADAAGIGVRGQSRSRRLPPRWVSPGQLPRAELVGSGPDTARFLLPGGRRDEDNVALYYTKCEKAGWGFSEMVAEIIDC